MRSSCKIHGGRERASYSASAGSSEVKKKKRKKHADKQTNTKIVGLKSKETNNLDPGSPSCTFYLAKRRGRIKVYLDWIRALFVSLIPCLARGLRV